jgi:hypothetical protein
VLLGVCGFWNHKHNYTKSPFSADPGGGSSIYEDPFSILPHVCGILGWSFLAFGGTYDCSPVDFSTALLSGCRLSIIGGLLGFSRPGERFRGK